MYRKSMIFILCCALMFITGCSGGGGESTNAGSNENAGEGAADKVTLSLFSGWTENNDMNIHLQPFMDMVKEKSGGTLEIVWGGGPEAIPANQLAEAIKNGVVDIAWTCHTYNVSHIPVAEGLKLFTASELRSDGGFEFVNQLYMDNLDAHYLGNPTDGLTYNLYSKKEITSFEDFKGMTFRATPAYQAFVEGLGAGAVNMSASEAYQALERNVIQGYGWPSVGIDDFGWQEVSEFIIEPAFYTSDLAIIVPDKVWSTLSTEQQTALLEAGKGIEEESLRYYEQEIPKAQEMLVDGGMKINKLPDDLAEEYYNMAYQLAWEKVIKADPENGQKLQEFSSFEMK